jgi:UDP:flavonoid glycosyltransferase YjiC (YdhE family)
LVLYDQVNTVGLLVADRCGVPAVQYNLGSVRTGRTHQAIAEHLADLCSRYAVAVSTPAMSLEMNPPSLLNRPSEGQFMRWVPYNGGAVIPGRLPAPRDGRPQVAVSMGTTTLEMFGLGSLASVVDAAAGVDADFALAVGNADLEPLGTLPPNVRHVGWVPLATLLRTCAALIHHGGGGSMLNAVAADVPQLIAHDPADLIHHIDFAVVRERGIGLVAPSDQVDAATIKTLFHDEGLRSATHEAHVENLSLPSPAATARSILELVGRHPQTPPPHG